MHNYEKLKKNKANWIVVAVIVLVAIISLIGWSNYRSHHLAGTYTNQATFLGVTSKTKLEFSNDKKVKMTNGTTSENDTYELSGNDLKIKNEDDEVIMRAKLADDRKSFIKGCSNSMDKLNKKVYKTYTILYTLKSTIFIIIHRIFFN